MIVCGWKGCWAGKYCLGSSTRFAVYVLMGQGMPRLDTIRKMRNWVATGRHEFDTLCTELGFDHRLTLPKPLQTNGMVERFIGCIEVLLQSHQFRSGEELETTLHRYVLLYNQQLPPSALGRKIPLKDMNGCHKLKLELFKKIARLTYGM